MILTAAAQSPHQLVTVHGHAIKVLPRNTAHKWLGCILSACGSRGQCQDLDAHMSAASKACFANNNTAHSRYIPLKEPFGFFPCGHGPYPDCLFRSTIPDCAPSRFTTPQCRAHGPVLGRRSALALAVEQLATRGPRLCPQRRAGPQQKSLNVECKRMFRIRTLQASIEQDPHGRGVKPELRCCRQSNENLPCKRNRLGFQKRSTTSIHGSDEVYRCPVIDCPGCSAFHPRPNPGWKSSASPAAACNRFAKGGTGKHCCSARFGAATCRAWKLRSGQAGELRRARGAAPKSASRRAIAGRESAHE